MTYFLQNCVYSEKLHNRDLRLRVYGLLGLDKPLILRDGGVYEKSIARLLDHLQLLLIDQQVVQSVYKHRVISLRTLPQIHHPLLHLARIMLHMYNMQTVTDMWRYCLIARHRMIFHHLIMTSLNHHPLLQVTL